MSKTEKFVEYVDWLIANCKEKVEIPEEVSSYLDALRNAGAVAEKPAFTDNGRAILEYLQSAPAGMYKAKDIAEGMGIASKSVSGAIRKLTVDGYVEKIGKDPVVYGITEKGKNVNLNEENN